MARIDGPGRGGGRAVRGLEQVVEEAPWEFCRKLGGNDTIRVPIQAAASGVLEHALPRHRDWDYVLWVSVFVVMDIGRPRRGAGPIDRGIGLNPAAGGIMI